MALLSIKTSLAQSAGQPNFVIIFADDLGYGDIEPFGNTVYKTPQLNRMANEGLKLTNFYVANSACTPSRAALLTGTFAQRNNMHTFVTFPGFPIGLHEDEITIAEMLKTVGYSTGIFGKWHLGDTPRWMPNNQGFDEFAGIPYSNDMWNYQGKINKHTKEAYTPLPYMRNNIPVSWIQDPNDQAILAEKYTDEALSFIEKNKNTPFFLYLPHSNPHEPRYATPEHLAAANGDVDRATVEDVDRSVGRVLDKLVELGLDNNTFVIFFSDNGPASGLTANPLRGRKPLPVYEGHMRVPTIAWWPGRIPSGIQSSEVAVSIDIMPLFAELSGASIPTDRVIDGKDSSTVLLGESGAVTQWPEFYYRDWGMRQNDANGYDIWKYVDLDDGQGTEYLFNLANDLSETTDIKSSFPDKLNELKNKLAQHVIDVRTNARPRGQEANPKPILKTPGTLPKLAEYVNAKIIWSSSAIVNSSQVSNNGTLIEALNFSSGNNSSNFNTTINGVMFKGFASENTNNDFPNPTAKHFSSNSKAVSTVDDYTSPPGLNEYDALLSRTLFGPIDGSYGNTVTLQNLIIDQEYEIQLFFGKTGGANRYTVINEGTLHSFGSPTTTNFGANTNGAVSKSSGGNVITGKFTATSSKLSFTISSFLESGVVGNPFYLNAYQLRAVNSTDISWQAQPILNSSSVSTNGALVEALNFSAGNNASALNTTINGVTFSGFVNGDASSIDFRSPRATHFSSNSAFVSIPDEYTSPPGLAEFDTLMSQWLFGSFNNGYGNEVTLSGLIVGETYEVQLFFGKTTGANRHIVINDGTSSAFGNQNTTNFGTSSTSSTPSNHYGTSIIGTFVATKSTKSFTITNYLDGNIPGAPFFLNGYQLRKPNSNSSWTSTKLTNTNDVITEGVLLEALNFASGSASSYNTVVNGVSFAGFTNNNASSLDFNYPAATYFSSNSKFVSTVDDYDSPPGLSAYETLLTNYLFGPVDSSFGNEVTISGLTPGKHYVVQLFFGTTANNNRHIVVNENTNDVFGTSSTTNFGNNTNASTLTKANPLGVSIINRFRADSNIKKFTLTNYANGNLTANPFMLAGYQLRDIGQVSSSNKFFLNKGTQGNSFKIFPNPCRNELYVSDLSGKGVIGNYEIYDFSGRLVVKSNENKAINNIDVSSIKSGIYFFNIETNEISETIKILIDNEN